MLFCGIDVAKHKHVIVVLDEAGEIFIPDMPIENTRDGFDTLLTCLRALDDDVTVGLEATGHYWLALYEALRPEFPVAVLNPLQVAAYRRCGLRKCKNDSADAVCVADLLRIGQVKPSPAHLDTVMQLRELTRFRHHLTEIMGDCKRKVLCILDKVFPEYTALFSDVFGETSRRLLSNAATVEEIAEFDLHELAELLRKHSRGRLGHAKAEALKSAAADSIGVGFLTDAVQLEIRCLIEQIDLLMEQRKRVEARLETLVAALDTPITTITGIGAVTGAAILAEIGDIHRFASLEKLVAYAGIDATVHQSGQFTATRTRMSKRGSPYLRHALWQCANAAVLYDPELREYYASRRAGGKSHGAVLGAVCRKLLARIMVVLKQNRPYEVRGLT